MVYNINSDFWKLFTHNRFTQDPGTNGACSLFGMDPTKHRSFAKHICSETYDVATQKWTQKGPNHFLDSTAYANCAAGCLGIRIRAMAAKPDRSDNEPSPSPPANRPAAQPKKKLIRLPAPMRKKGGARVAQKAANQENFFEK